MVIADVSQVVAAVDVGSNAIRMVLATVSRDGDVQLLQALREPVRLGRDVFDGGVISEETTERALEAFGRFRALADETGARQIRAVATSALREAHNREVFVDRVLRETNIDIHLIGGEEEARLVTLAVARTVKLSGKVAMLIDIGGGSVEVTIMRDGEISAARSFNMGTVRMLQRMRDDDEGNFHRLVREYAEITHIWLDTALAGDKVDVCVGTGGNCEALSALAKTQRGGREGPIAMAELDVLVKILKALNFQERMDRFGMRPDRADVIVPAAIVLQTLMQQAGAEALTVPGVGLKDGLLYDMVPDLLQNKKDLHHDQVIGSCLLLGRKYAFDEPHGRAVSRLALDLFDRTRELHHLDDEARLLLEAAALLHDIGSFVNVSGHHKHTQYLINASPVVGLSDSQRAIVANVGRYHRKSAPTVRHEPFRELQARERLVVTKLSAILRVADALDAEHAGKVRKVRVDFKRPRLVLKLAGDGDLLLEKWAISRKAGPFEETFGVKLAVDIG